MTGCLQIYTGDGKGKTTAAIGAGLRAIGHGLRVHMIQFLKGGGPFPISGELRALDRLDGFTVEQFGTDGFVKPGAATDDDRQIVQAAFRRARQVLDSDEYDLVILDELNVAVRLALLAEEDVLDLMSRKPPHVELIITGRGAPQTVLDRADLVTEMHAVKHPFMDGTAARPGVDF